MFNSLDKKFMGVALDEAKKAYSNGQLPIGALLIIDKEIVGFNSNKQINKNDWFHHAENILIQKNGEEIKKARKDSKGVWLYSTLEPCLMCLGAAVQNRLTRIVYACPDPSAGSSHIQPPTEWYEKKWPEIVQGPFAKKSYNLFVSFMKKDPQGWKNILPLYKNLKIE